MMKPTAASLALLTAVAVAGPAWAHSEITPSTFPTGRPVFFALAAANEESEAVTRVVVQAPDGADLGAATSQPPGWTAERAGQTLTWTGSLAPGTFERWGFELEPVGQPGPLRFGVTLTTAGGQGHEDQVEVTAVAGSTVTTPAAAGPVESTTTTTVVAQTTGPEAEAASAEASAAEDRATAALVVGIIGVMLASAAVGMAVRRRASPPAAGAAEGPKEEQDW